MKNVKTEENTLIISNLKILFNDDYFNVNTFRDNDMPLPLFFGIPVLACHVKLITKEEKNNFIQKTIIELKNKNYHKDEIADMLCLDKQLVSIILDNDKKDGEVNNEEKIEQKDFFIFYNLLTNEWINGYIPADYFQSMFSDLRRDCWGKGDKNNIIYYRKNIGDSRLREIRFLGELDMFERDIEPSPKDIINCYKYIETFNEDSYVSPEYMNECYPLVLTTAYTITRYNSNHFTALNPFETEIGRISYSYYFFDIIKRFGENISAWEKDIIEYEERIKNSQIKRQNTQLVIKNDKEKKAYEFLQAKYGKYNFFQAADSICDQMVKFQSNYQIIISNDGKKDVSSQIRNFYDCINNTLEGLFKITYEPFQDKLITELKKDSFFEKVGNSKNNRDSQSLLKKYYEIIGDEKYSAIRNRTDVDNVNKIIHYQNIMNDRLQPNIIDLFTLNVLSMYYFNRKTQFSFMFNGNVDNICDTIILVNNNRNQARHVMDAIDDISNVKNIYETVIAMIDSCMGVAKTDMIENDLDDSDESFEAFIGEYKDLDDLPETLQKSCNTLLRDYYNKSELYFSDCVIALENITQYMISFSMGRVDSIEQITNIFEFLPKDGEELKLYLIDKLPFSDKEKESVLSNIENLRIDIEDAKNYLINNYRNMKASTKVLFAPILLSCVDYMAFIDLFQKLGCVFFDDINVSISKRGHSGQAVDWSTTKVINKNIIEYSKTINKFYKGEF